MKLWQFQCTGIRVFVCPEAYPQMITQAKQSAHGASEEQPENLHSKSAMRAANLLRWIAVLGLGVATLCIYHPIYSASSRVNVSGFETFALAESIVNHHSFSDPFEALPTGPSAHMGPLFPAYLALIIRVFGEGSRAVGVLMWAASLTLALQLMMLPLLAKHLGLGFWTGILAGAAWLAAGIPPALSSEATLASLLVVAAAYLMGRCFARETSGKHLFIWAFVWAALLLLHPVTVVVLAFWLLLLHFRSRRSTRQKIALGLLPILLVAPWIGRNLLVFHKLFFIRDNLGLELAVSNNSCASFRFDVNVETDCFGLSHPNLNYEEALKVRQLGEIEYNRLRLQEALAWIRANPGAFCSLSTKRFKAFWLPPPSSNAASGVLSHAWILNCFTLLSIPGMFFMWRNSRVGAYVVGSWLVFFPLIYYFIQYMNRYRYPILWASFLAGSYFLVELVRGIMGKKETQCAPTTVSSSEAD